MEARLTMSAKLYATFALFGSAPIKGFIRHGLPFRQLPFISTSIKGMPSNLFHSLDKRYLYLVRLIACYWNRFDKYAVGAWPFTRGE